MTQENKLYDVVIVKNDKVSHLPGTRMYLDMGWYSAVRMKNTWISRGCDRVEIVETGKFSIGDEFK